jgi:hypothetical protein
LGRAAFLAGLGFAGGLSGSAACFYAAKSSKAAGFGSEFALVNPADVDDNIESR